MINGVSCGEICVKLEKQESLSSGTYTTGGNMQVKVFEDHKYNLSLSMINVIWSLLTSLRIDSKY